MAYKNILVHLDSSAHCEARLDLAINLAHKYQAHLTGIYVITHPYYTPQQDGVEEASLEVEALFIEKATKAGISAHWRLVDKAVAGATVVESINLYAYYNDLIIVGQTAHDTSDNIPADLPERVVLGAGRPVLVVPFVGKYATVGEHVMVAWFAGRESARALHDALPFLKNAQNVSLVRIGAATGECGDGVPGANLCDYLSHHGIRAKMDNIIAEVSVGDILLNHAWENGSDLLVMGAYSRTKRGTLALSPVAKNALKHMTVPVFFSH